MVKIMTDNVRATVGQRADLERLGAWYLLGYFGQFLEGQKLGRSTLKVSNAYNSASEWTSIINPPHPHNAPTSRSGPL